MHYSTQTSADFSVAISFTMSLNSSRVGSVAISADMISNSSRVGGPDMIGGSGSSKGGRGLGGTDNRRMRQS